MPPKRERLPDSVLSDLKKWIEMGAPDPREGERGSAGEGEWKTSTGEDFWAYQPPRRSEPPAVRDGTWPRRELDRFILAELAKHDLAPSPDAPANVLLRRVYFDLIGLPPSPDDLAQFEERARAVGMDAALAATVDELLASPQFGERWGRHWLDVARFAESSGKEANISFPYAWRYRDYVIDCLNDDVPFDGFITEQIAGDLLPHESNAERARLLIATGFLALGPKNLDEGDRRQFQADLIDEQIDAVTRAITASSVACARCHDHKFDPFSMQDYYALAGIFASTKTYFGTAVSPANRAGGDPLPLPSVEGQQIFHQSIPAERVEKLKEELKALKAEKPQTITDALRVFWRSGAIEGELERVSDSGEALPLAVGVLDRETIADAPLLERGEVGRPGRPVRRDFPQAIEVGEEIAIPKDQSGRLQLAQWLTHPQHPLTSRVIVNRIWHHLFGAGLVRTVDNFGSSGERPSHPELLDTLAVQFVESGWSIKQMIRELVLSRTYRQASTYRDGAFQRDPESRLLWRMPKRRLEAEAIRDAMLSVCGELDLARPAGSLVARVIGDKPISLIGLDKRLPKDLDGSTHRSVYLPVIRDRLPDVLDLFDFAEASLVTGNRETTNVPTQALYLMNSPFVHARAGGLASRLVREADSDEERVRRAFLLCFSREPGPAERDRALAFLSEKQASAESDSSAPPQLVSFCRALLSTAEFRNLD
jgi:hypothetical protein